MSETQTELDDWDGGNPDPTPGNNPPEYPTRTCPLCGDDVKKLPHHLRHTCEANQ
jgi:hypothetical protein